jgi:hypothetical protein
MVFRKAAFLVLYASVGGCVAFTVANVLGLPGYAVGLVVGVVFIRLADRVGRGFGVAPILAPNERPTPRGEKPEIA